MQDFDEQEMLFLRENVVLEKVNGKIVINVIKADVQTVEGSVSWVEGSVSWVDGHVDRAGSASRVEGRVDKAGSVRWVSNEESES